MSLLEIVKKEISELHTFFELYFKGELSDDTTRFSEVLDSSFRIVTPTALLVSRESIINIIKKSYNTRLDINIWTEDVDILEITETIVGATYYELQKSNGSAITKRISTALFRKDKNTPNGLKWLHVHETWVIEK